MENFEKSPKDQQLLIQNQNQEDRLAMEAVEELCKFGKSAFRSLDKDKDNRLSEPELKKAIDSGMYSGKELDYLKAMRNHIAELQTVTFDGTKWPWAKATDDTDGISKRDLNRLQQSVGDFIPKLETARVAREVLNRSFSAIDTDKSGDITLFELRAASRNPKFNFYDRSALNLARGIFFSADDFKNEFTTDKGFLRVLQRDGADRCVESLEKKTGTRDVQLRWAIARDLKRR
jgi:Ca2+-binding EF-hand superfamily protein